MSRTTFGQLGGQSLVYGLASVLGSAATIVLIPLLTRALSPAEYGQLELLSTAVAQVGVLMQLGLGSALFKMVLARGVDAGREAEMLTTAFFTMIGVAVAVSVVILPFTPQVARVLLGDGSASRLVSLSVVKLFCDAVGVVPMVYLRLKRRAVLFGAISAGRLILTLGLTVLAWRLPVPALEAVFIAIAVESFVFAAVGASVLRPVVSANISTPDLRAMLAFGLPLVPYGMGLTLLALGDRYVLRWFADVDSVGVYAVGYKLAAMLGIPIRAFQVAWPGVMFSVVSEASAPLFYARTLRYLLVILGCAGVVLATFSDEAVAIFAGPAFLAASKVVPVLLFAQIGLGAFYATAVGTNVTGKTYYQLYAVAMAIAGFALLAPPLVTSFGAPGAAIATAIGYLILAAADCYFSLRLFWVPYEWGRLAILVGIVVALCVVGSTRGVATSPGDWFFKLGVVAACPLALMALRVVSAEEVRTTGQMIAQRLQRLRVR